MGSAAAAGADAMAAEATSPHDPLWPGQEPDGRGAHGLGPASSSPSHPASPPHDVDAARSWPFGHDLRRLADNSALSSIDSAPQLDHNGSNAPLSAPSICHPSRSTQLQQPTGVAGQSPHEENPPGKWGQPRAQGACWTAAMGQRRWGGALNPPWDDAPPPSPS